MCLSGKVDYSNQTGRQGVTIRIIFFTCLAFLGLNAAWATECPDSKPLYMAIGPVESKFHLKNQGTSDFLDEKLGKEQWRLVQNEPISIKVPVDNKSSAVIISVPRDSDTHDHYEMEVYLEWHLDFTDDGKNRRVVKGHKKLGSYKIPENSISEISVPQEIFKENAALIVIVQATKKQGIGREILVASKDVAAQKCNNLVYVTSRRTAILLNQGKALKTGDNAKASKKSKPTRKKPAQK